MKRILFGRGTGHVPFWQPWGCLGCLWRLLLFLVLLILLLLLLSLFRGCHDTEGGNPVGGIDRQPIVEMPDEFRRPDDTYIRPDSLGGGENGDNTGDNGQGATDPDWNQPVEGGEDAGLPAPEDNTLPPFEDMEPVPDPDNDGATNIYPNLLYVIFNSDTDDEAFKTFAKKFTSLYPEPDHKIQYYNTSSKTAVLEVPEQTRMEICEKLPGQIPEVKFLVVPVEVMMQSEAVTPDDPVFKYPKTAWFFSPIQAQEAWGITQGSPNIIVGIVDSYMDLNHEELKGDRIVSPFSIVKGTADVSPESGMPMEYVGHGTFVTSVAVGTANNKVGSSGIAPLCKFMPVSVGKYLNTVTMVEGLLYCMYHGADVINLSCGTQFNEMIKRLPVDDQIKISQQTGKAQEKMWDYVFKLAEERNVTIVWAAGNENVFGPMDTSKRNKNTIRVAAVDRDLHKASFSNYGNFSDKGLYESTISAPGVDIFGALPNNSYDCWPGTSFSAPIIAGTVALMKSLNNNLTTEQIIKILQETGKPVEGAPEIGKLVQIKDALLKVKGMVGDFSTNTDDLLGTWESTQAMKVYINNEYINEKSKIRLTITSAKNGKVVFIKTDGRRYEAPATVNIADKKITVKMNQEAVPQQAGDDAKFSIHIFNMQPDEDGKMKCLINSSSDRTTECYLYKVEEGS